MSKYICVENFLKYIDDTICKGCREDGKDANGIVCRACQIMDMLGYVDDFPAADVEPVIHAKWIEYPRAHYFKCSNCKYTVPYKKAMLYDGQREYNYCPSCGTKMDKG